MHWVTGILFQAETKCPSRDRAVELLNITLIVMKTEYVKATKYVNKLKSGITKVKIIY
jgi:hypothetical protein